VSLIDVLPTLRAIAGLPPDPDLPGTNVLGPVPADRPILSEYHAQGMINAGYMLKSGRWKYCYYGRTDPPQLFDLEADPMELRDLSGHRPDVVARLDVALRAILDPDQTNDRAQAEQAARAN
jgi:choline-sulfatase